VGQVAVWSKGAAVRVATDDGVSLAVETTGVGAPFLLIHGFTGAKEDFSDHVARFTEHARVVTFDHRGHGESDHPTEASAYSLDRLAADALAVADALGLERFRLLGHSMGGMVTRRLALAHSDRVEALVLMATSSGPPDGIDPERVDAAARVALTDGMTALRALLDEADVLGSEADQRVQATRAGYVEFNARKWAQVSPVAYAALAREIVAQPQQLDAMTHIGCPTLVIVGEQDACFVEDATRMAATIPDAALVVVPDAGHSPQFENPEPWFAAVDGFLRRATSEAQGVA
jgi:2-succinyl-6-hydroxy-2,4-cyclohexadiene-1-carboxylate synthase